MAAMQSLFSFLLFLSAVLCCSSGVGVSRHHDSPKDLVRSSCVHASYPTLCLRTLSSYSGPAINTPRDLAQAAVGISISHARHAAGFLATVQESGSSGLGAKGKRESAALSDCMEQLGDSVDDLSRTLGVLKHLQTGGSFRWEVSNAETWVSAALTNEDTCLDGFDGVDGEIKAKVKRRITKVARVTSNALYMINRLDGSRGWARTVDP